MTTPGSVRQVTSADEVAVAADLIARSFDHLAANHYLVPDPARRLATMRGFFHLLAAHAAAGAGEVLLTADRSATAVWFDRTTEPGAPERYEERLAELAGPHHDRFVELDDLFEAHHPGEPHWHLAFLAVDPTQWKRGLGSALMRITHARLDRAGLPAYLEATGDDNRRLYRRHGYVDLTPSAIRLGDGTPFHRMWRVPADGGR
ncbi:GNAT family N-acetyltransferase [Micromonospora sp. WMMD882]|uniref:GNAT family N-acetyltransferase n=1 Tax=Micromonospora sp. WMMD882 TaxID=3015151 RepID=UPI00248BE42E|nr:GNAT family N-acetyltransferase [Micromonospora sp. WMMD882]WBB79848.1 GNAT family N-acetyltransferase [Micromonospora sp. WMMD882]